MRPTDYPYDHQRISAYWAGQRAPLHAGTLDPLVLDSWRRCAAHFATPRPPCAPHDDLETRLERQSALITTAVPYLEDIHQFIAGAISALLLTDRDGVVLAVEGGSAALDLICALKLGVGACWSETQLGTNAIALSLITAMPTQVVGAEHFLSMLHPFGDSAAPIHDEYGTIIGCIALLTDAAAANQTQIALVMTTARAITAQLQADVILKQSNQQLHKLDHILRSVADGVITWNNARLIDHVNPMACQLLGVPPSAMLGRPLHRALAFSDYIASMIDHPRELNDAETTIQIGDRFVKCLITLRTIRDGAGEVVGGAATLRALSLVRSFVHQQTGALSSLTLSDFDLGSPAMHTIVRQARAAAKGSLPVLISGERGAGKTALAQAIHNASPRSGKPLVVVNCSAIPSEFIAEELLGKEAHGSEAGRPSKFELADGGTLLLDQIDQLSLQGQEIVLRVVNSRSVTRLGARRTTHVNVRIIATTTRSIEEMVGAHSFLAPLAYLFSVFSLHMPPLRDRQEDIIRLAHRFLERAGGLELDEDAAAALERHAWHGNVRELESAIERAALYAGGQRIAISDLPETVARDHAHAQPPQPVLSLAEAERDAIIRAGWASGGVLSEMAAALGISRSTLWRKFKQYGICADDFKAKA